MAMATVSVGANVSFASAFSDSSVVVSLRAASPAPSSAGLSAQAPLLLKRPLIEAKKETTRRDTVRIRHARIRKKLSGTSERPRLAVFRSNLHMYAQVIDDTEGCTLISASTIQKNLRDELSLSAGPTVDAAKRIGEEIAKACLAKGITKVAFDRGGFVYHGRIKALADSAREHGLDF